jgi:hypothetical protein
MLRTLKSGFDLRRQAQDLAFTGGNRRSTVIDPRRLDGQAISLSRSAVESAASTTLAGQPIHAVIPGSFSKHRTELMRGHNRFLDASALPRIESPADCHKRGSSIWQRPI